MAKSSAAASITVIIPVRGRSGQRLRNALRSLHRQTAGRPAAVVLVSHGSSSEVNRELELICADCDAKLIALGRPSEAWNKSLALNVGIQSSSPDVPYLMMMDADMILAPTFLRTVLDVLISNPSSLVLCRSSDLPEGAEFAKEKAKFETSLARLRAQSKLRPRYGTGGIQAGPRTFFFRVRGYDEDLLWWGGMDGDMVARARLAGLRTVWIEDRTFMLHQWHPKKFRALIHSSEMAAAQQAWMKNHELVARRAKRAERNPQSWGITELGTLSLRDYPKTQSDSSA